MTTEPETVEAAPAPKKRELTFGRVKCPHCPEVRQGREVMEEHIESKHPAVRRIGDAQEVLPGSDVMPDDIVQQLDTITGAFREEGQSITRDDEIKISAFAAALPQWKGKKMPEFIIMWDREYRAHNVRSDRWPELMFRKGFTLRPPTIEQYERFWFHFTCPIPTCDLNRKKCQAHGEYGKDSNHPLRSPEFMMIQHLQSGGKIHRQYYEMHKAELQEKYREAFAAFEMELQERAAASVRARELSDQNISDELAGVRA